VHTDRLGRPIANWVAACDAMIALDAPTVVPGHGPITDPDGIRAVRAISRTWPNRRGRLPQGFVMAEAADTIDLGEYASWLDAERVVVNVYQRYRELDPNTPLLEIMALLVMQAEWWPSALSGRESATGNASPKWHRRQLHSRARVWACPRLNSQLLKATSPVSP